MITFRDIKENKNYDVYVRIWHSVYKYKARAYYFHGELILTTDNQNKYVIREDKLDGTSCADTLFLNKEECFKFTLDRINLEKSSLIKHFNELRDNKLKVKDGKATFGSLREDEMYPMFEVRNLNIERMNCSAKTNYGFIHLKLLDKLGMPFKDVFSVNQDITYTLRCENYNDKDSFPPYFLNEDKAIEYALGVTRERIKMLNRNIILTRKQMKEEKCKID